MIWLCGDPGSCHDGSLEKARELVKIGAGCGLNAVKFQLLGLEQIYKNGRFWEDAHTGKITTAGEPTGNVKLKWEYLPELMDLGKSLGIEVFASVFNRAGAEYLYRCGCASIKFAYSQKKNLGWACDHKGVRSGIDFKTVFVSSDVMNRPDMVLPDVHGDPLTFDVGGSGSFVHLYCVSEYPVQSQLDFEGLFDGERPRFQGFSSHCLGIQQEIRAVEAGAKFLEFHIKGDWRSACPDALFAKPPKLAEKLIKKIRYMPWEEPRHTVFKDIPFKSSPAVPFSPDAWDGSQ